MTRAGALARRVAVVIAVAALAALPFGTTGAARAQPEPLAAQDEEEAHGPRLEIEAIRAIVSPGNDVRIRVRIHNDGDDPLDDVRLLSTVHERQTTRWGLQRALDEGRVGSMRDGFSADVGHIGAGRAHTIRIRRSVADLGLERSEPGVYPVRVQLQRDGGVEAEAYTSIILTPAEVDRPVSAAVVVPFDAIPALRPDGTYDEPRLVEDLRTAGRLQTLAGSMGAAQPATLTVATNGLLLEQLADLASGYTAHGPEGPTPRAADAPLAVQAGRLLERLRSLLGQEHVEHVALPYGPADLVALVRGGMSNEAVRQVTEGQRVSELHGGSRPRREILWPAEGVDRATLSELSAAGVDTVVLGSDYLEDGAAPRNLSPPAARELRTAAGARGTVLIPDPWIEAYLRRDLRSDGGAVAAQRVLAETALLYFEQPSAGRRAVLIAPPQMWDPPRRLLRGLVDGMEAAPWLETVPLSQLQRTLDRDDSSVRVAYPSSSRERELPDQYVEQLSDARRAMAALSGVLSSGDDTLDRFDRLLLRAASVHYRRPGLMVEGRQLIRTVRTTVADLYEAVEVVEGPAVALAGAEGQVPVTLVNHSAVRLDLRVELLTQRYEFGGGATQPVTLAPEETRTVVFHARALTPGGTHPIRVVVEDTNGLVELADGTVVVRSAGVNLVAVIVTGGAGLFLFVWWVRQLRRQRAEVAVEEEPSPPLRLPGA